MYTKTAISAICGLCFLGLMGCSTPDASDPQNNQGEETLELKRNSEGDLVYCADAGTPCVTLPYDGECATIEITIDTTSGESCQLCVLADGTEIDGGCHAVAVECVLVTIPDPDCVVCAYVNGDVIFSTCAPAHEPECTSNADCANSGGVAGYCLEGVCIYEPGCKDDSDCPEGFLCVSDGPSKDPAIPTWEYGICMPREETCAADEDCMSPDGRPGWCLNGICVFEPYNCDTRQVLCAMFPPTCPEGLVHSVSLSCYGPCVEPELCAPMACSHDEPCPDGFSCKPVVCTHPEERDCTPQGLCVPEPAQPATCAGKVCQTGWHCQMQDVVCVTAPCPPIPTCVPNEEPHCLDDADCPVGHICVLPPCFPGEACPGHGVCIAHEPPPPPDLCVSDDDCPPGFYCAIWCGTEPTSGICLPIEPPPSECANDADCPAGMVCEEGLDATGTPLGGVCVPAPDPAQCRRTGCSGEVCADREVATTCEVQPVHACFKNAACERQSDGRCGWTMTEELTNCMAENR